jgi:catechol 2,3-dioxygenase-like lactoylglutathione lyase family enzyme
MTTDANATPTAATSRVQLALNVADIEAATQFYADMFGVQPAKQRPGYANFVVADPPLKLVLFENPGSESALNHLGVEMPTSQEVAQATQRFTEAGLAHTTAEIDACCHAVQDKAWVDAPDVPLGAWEFYTVLDDSQGTDDTADSVAGTCCTTDVETARPCCAGQGCASASQES